MSSLPTPLPAPTPDERRTAAEHFQHANHWLVARKPEKALPFLRHCCQLDPANLIYRQALHAGRKQSPPASGLMAGLRRWHLSRKLDTALRAQDPVEILLAAEAVLDLDHANPNAYRALAQVFESVGLIEQAVWSLEQTDSADASVTTELRRLYERAGRFSQARSTSLGQPDAETQSQIAILRKQIEAAPADAPLYLQLSRLFRRGGDLNAARDWLERALTATRNNFELLLERADLDLSMLRQDITIANDKLAADPSNRDLQEVIARLQHELMSRELDMCRQRSERFPADQARRLELGVQMLKAGQFEAALDEFKVVRGDDKLGWRALVYSGYCHLNQGNLKRAAACFEEALPLIPPEAESTRADVISKLAQ